MLHTYVLVINEHFFESHKIAEGQQHFEHFAYQLVLAIPVQHNTEQSNFRLKTNNDVYIQRIKELSKCKIKHRKVPEKQK